MSRAAETTPARFLGIADGTGFLGRAFTPAERYGFEAFFRGPIPPNMGHEVDAGWNIAAQVVFAQGALAAAAQADHAGCPVAEIIPYPKLTPAHSAYRDGFNAMAHGAIEIED